METTRERSEDATMVDDFLETLKTRQRSVAIWGCGAIGSSAAYHLSKAGFRCIGYDIVKERVRELHEGRFQSTSTLIDGEDNSRPDLGVTATSSWHDLETERVAVHLVCVPTERATEPSSAALADVIPSIAAVIKKTEPGSLPPIISIESTILPSWVEDIARRSLKREGLELGVDVLLGAAPRRDWFNGATYTIETLPRIVGGCDARTTELLVAFYSVVSSVVQPAMDAEHAAFTKVIENVIRYEGITFGNRLALAFPQYDMRHILRLASTKWNIPYYFPSLGIGGHCIPLAPRYVVEEGGEDNPYLDAVRGSLAFNETYAESLFARELGPILEGKRSVGILGLAYTPDAKMHKLSPAFGILETLRDTPRLRLHDPFYSADEIYDLCSVPELQFPEDLHDCDALILNTAHTSYVRCPVERYVSAGTVIVDNTGAWAHRPFVECVEYFEVGRVRGRPGPASEPYSSTAD